MAREKPASEATLEAGLESLHESLEELSELVFAAKASGSVDHLESAIESLEKVQALVKKQGPEGTAARGVGRFSELVQALLVKMAGRIDKAVALGPMTVQVLPEDLRGRFVSKDGQFAVYAVPKASVWDRDKLEVFLTQLRAISPEITGFPETFYENTGLIQRGFIKASVYAALAVLLLLFIDLRNPRNVLLAALPVGLGALWMAGTMSLISMPYNLANIIGLPLVIGVGIDNGVHLIHRFIEEKDVEIAAVRTGSAVVLSSLTTMVGFGSLGLASHRGYGSLGGILFLGVGACLVAAIVVLPAALASKRSV